MIPGAANPLLLASAAGAAEYQIECSLRFNSSDSAYLSKNFGSAGNRKTWTWAGWVKNCASSANSYPATFLSARNGGNSGLGELFWVSITNAFTASGFQIAVGDGSVNYCVTAAFYRDPSSWYHIHVAYDSTQTVAANRLRLYVNGAEVIQYSTDNRASITQNSDGAVNRTSIPHYIGNRTGVYSDCYLADIHFIDGQALDPTSFGEFDTNGVWQPKAYAGTYGTNGFHLPFSDNSTAAALGTDTSGAGNNWTVNNISVTAGAGNDSLVDTPTNYGEVRGNYCTWNPLDAFNMNGGSWPLSDGNLVAADNASNIYGTVSGTLAVSSGKWYWEISTSVGLSAIDAYAAIGIEEASKTGRRFAWSGNLGYYAYFADGRKLILNGTQSSYGSSWTLATLGVALDLDGGTITFYKNNVSQGSIPVSNDRAYRPIVSDFNNAAGTIFTANFGQRPFAFSAPLGFKALCTTNLPDPQTITTSGSYTGNGVADGPFVYLNGVPTAMTVNGNAVTFGTHADKLSNGFKIRTTSTTYNQNASTYNYSITSTGDPFKTARAQ